MSGVTRGQFASSVGWKILERGGASLVSLVVQIVMARLLSPEQFGALAVMLVFINLGNVFVQSGLNTALVQSPGVDDNDCSTVFWLSLGISLLLYAAVFAAAPTVARFYAMPEIIWPLRFLTLQLVINAYNSVQIAVIQRALEFRKVFRATMVSVFISGILGIGLAFLGAGLWALVIQQLIYQFTNCVVLASQVSWRPRFVFKPKRAKELFSFGWKLLVSGLLDQGYQSFADLVIGKQFSASSLGLVSQGKKYPAAVGSMLDGAIQPVMLSAVSRVQTDIDQVKRLVRRALKTSTFLIVPSMTLFAVCAEPLVRILLGEQWIPCVAFLQMYCVVYMLLPIHTTNLQALNGMGRSDLFLRLELIKKAYGLTNLLIMAFIFQDVYLMVGSYILTSVISTIINAWPNKKVIGYSYFEQVRDICPAFLLAGVSGSLAWSVRLIGMTDLVTVFLQIIVMAVSYLGFARLFRVEASSYLVSAIREIIAARKECA